MAKQVWSLEMLEMWIQRSWVQMAADISFHIWIQNKQTAGPHKVKTSSLEYTAWNYLQVHCLRRRVSFRVEQICQSSWSDWHGKQDDPCALWPCSSQVVYSGWGRAFRWTQSLLKQGDGAFSTRSADCPGICNSCVVLDLEFTFSGPSATWNQTEGACCCLKQSALASLLFPCTEILTRIWTWKSVDPVLCHCRSGGEHQWPQITFVSLILVWSWTRKDILCCSPALFWWTVLVSVHSRWASTKGPFQTGDWCQMLRVMMQNSPYI